ncbi:MAG: tRNA (adenosine(37)-N6)-dimethylallyltransferase MiaA [Clostridiales bacterium]|nr:tRNA (adenosine(37)-N6)-dimethylallyltransferase MiaA [Clostridiales bacterium]
MIDISKSIPGYKYIPVITGPTASGKSSLALDVCRKTGGELISADSMQIYKGLDIGTAKDTSEERAEIIHHMTDIAEPGTYFNVSDYVTACYEVIDSLIAHGKLPVICGGTGQYISALYYGFDYGKDASADEETARLEEEFARDGIEGIYARLVERDPEAAAKIHPNNTRRVIRALAVIESTGKTFTEKNNESTNEGPKYPFKLFMIDMDREVLYDRINRRVDIMLDEGLEQEARALYDSDADKKSTCFQAIGYKEFKDYFEGASDIDEAVYNIKLRSRHYAKRQLTWFRAMGDDVIKLSPSDAGKNVQQVLDTISL